MTNFIPRALWQPVKSFGAIGLHKGCVLHVAHVRRVADGAESVELRVIYRQPDGSNTENKLHIDRHAIPALIRLLEALR